MWTIILINTMSNVYNTMSININTMKIYNNNTILILLIILSISYSINNTIQLMTSNTMCILMSVNNI